MNLKLLILCINAVAATTSHNHHLLRQKPEHHDIAFRATKSDLRRLLKGEEKAPNQDLEALHVLRGSSRFLKDLICDDGQGNTETCDGDEDTHECKNGKCKEVCDKDKDCNGNGECKDGDCDCHKGFEGKDCSKQAVEYYIVVDTEVTDEERSIECLAALKSLEKDIEGLKLPTTVTAESNRSKRTRNRHLKPSSSGDGALKIVLSFNAGPFCSRDKLLNQVWGQVNGEGSEHTNEDDRSVSSLSDADFAVLNCLVEASEDILKDTDDEKDVTDGLNELISTPCAVADTDDIACIVECNNKIEDDCEEELKEEEKDCEGVHDELKDCYEKCYGL